MMTDSADAETPLVLSPEEARVLGCLLEKEATVPDSYPLTQNSLLLACNQKSNRNPVVDYDEELLEAAIEGLRENGLLYRVDVAGSRVAKYRHAVEESLGLSRGVRALLTVLLLRGPQTLGELRTRTERMHAFATLELVEQEIQDTAEDVEIALWQKLPQAPGQKEARYAHLLCGAVSEAIAEAPLNEQPAVGQSIAAKREERIADLENKVERLEGELSELQASFAEFRKQFD